MFFFSESLGLLGDDAPRAKAGRKRSKPVRCVAGLARFAPWIAPARRPIEVRRCGEVGLRNAWETRVCPGRGPAPAATNLSAPGPGVRLRAARFRLISQTAHGLRSRARPGPDPACALLQFAQTIEERAVYKDLSVLLGVSGGVAAYKACVLARLLVKRGASVRVVMTP